LSGGWWVVGAACISSHMHTHTHACLDSLQVWMDACICVGKVIEKQRELVSEEVRGEKTGS
jgi:hypothetical protein